MKFAEHLQSHLTPEWRKQYVPYETLKAMLYEVLEAASGVEQPQEEHQNFFAEKDMEFLRLCDDELCKVDLFFHQKLAEAKSRFLELKSELEEALQLPGSDKFFGAISKRSLDPKAMLKRAKADNYVEKAVKSIQELKFAYTEYYLSLILLQNYQELNFTGFRKILKKHDKLWQTSSGMQWRAHNVLSKPFAVNKEVDELIVATEDLFIKHLEGGNRSKAMNRLRVPPLSEKQSPWTTFWLGWFLGCFLVLVLAMLLSIWFKNVYDPEWLGVRLFRPFVIIFVNVFLVGLNMYGWQIGGVNHVLIFEIDPRRHLTYQSLMQLSAMFLCVWAICALCYIYHDVLEVPKLVFPLAMMAICVLWLVNPFDFMYRSARAWFLREVCYCFTPICRPVKFPDFWLADQMNSLVTVFLDIEYFLCFYFSEVDWAGGLVPKYTSDNGTDSLMDPGPGLRPNRESDMCNTSLYGLRPMIAALPATIRFFQCTRRFVDSRNRHPHFTNAGKYATTFFVVLFRTLQTWHRERDNIASTGEPNTQSPFFYLWILAYIVSTIYVYIWDIQMDWGMFQKKADGKYHFREELIYSHVWYYYFAICADLVLRMAWTLNISVNYEEWKINADIIICITAALECFRRCVWNFFRLENEHLNNAGEFRAVRDISLKPIRRQRSDLDRLLASNRIMQQNGKSRFGIAKSMATQLHIGRHHHGSGNKKHVKNHENTLVRRQSAPLMPKDENVVIELEALDSHDDGSAMPLTKASSQGDILDGHESDNSVF